MSNPFLTGPVPQTEPFPSSRRSSQRRVIGDFKRVYRHLFGFVSALPVP
jgi:hypothetical protein